MRLVLITALGIGLSTVIGALLGFCFRKVPHSWHDGIMGFAAGIMLAAAVIGIMVEWQLLRCPMCGRHLGWLDKEICASCAAAIAESEEREKRR